MHRCSFIAVLTCTALIHAPADSYGPNDSGHLIVIQFFDRRARVDMKIGAVTESDRTY